MQNLQSKILLDNTTIYGAKYAYNAWPPTVDEWFEHPNAVNIRSLMDILESIILYDRLIVDASSRMVYGEREVYENIWHLLFDLRNRQGENIFDDVGFAYIGKGVVISSVVRITFEKLLKHLQDGTFKDINNGFQKENIDFIVPQFYRTAQEFSTLFAKSFPSHVPKEKISQYYENPILFLPTDIQEYLIKVEQILSNSPAYEANYAMFAFRGFYYQELAHLFSISYSPHTWRSNLFNLSTENTSINFAKYVTGVTEEVRRELANKLNSELHTTAFSIEFPVISTYVVHQCRNRGQLLNVAMQIRETPSAKLFREWVKEIQSSIRNQSDLPKIVKAKLELEHTLKGIRQELGLTNDTKTEKVTVKVTLPTPSIEIPVPLQFGIPEWMEQIIHRRSHLLFLREITRASVSFSPFVYRYSQLQP